MAEDALVNDDIRRAANLVSFLEDNGLKVSGALWLYQSETDRWRFLISFAEQRRDVTTFYLDAAKLINRLGRDKDLLDLGKVDIVEAQKSVIGPLSRAMRVDGSSQVRFTANRINGVFLEDALIYRLAA